MGTPVFIILMLSGFVLMLFWAFSIHNRRKRHNYLWATHLVTIVPGSVGISNHIVPPTDAVNVLLALLLTVSLVVIIWFAVAWIHAAAKRINNKPQV